jgi:hypothetical protein
VIKDRIPSLVYLPHDAYIQVNSYEEICDDIEEMFYGYQPQSIDSLENHNLIFTTQAFEEFKSIVHWGQTHPNNIMEQRFRGIGYNFTDLKHNYHVVCFFQYIPSPNRTKYGAGSENTMSIQEELDFYLKFTDLLNPFGKKFGAPKVIIMGHTHPNSLPVFMSGTDIVSHELGLKPINWITMIANPHTQKIRAWIGAERDEMQIILPVKQLLKKQIIETPDNSMKKISKENRYLILQNETVVAKFFFFTKRLFFITLSKKI